MSLPPPTNQELAYLATLITDRPSSLAVAPPEELINPETLLQRLDYHGITLLAAEQKKLPDALDSTIKQRRSMLVANNVIKQRALVKLFSAFNDAGLTNCVLFKGSALAHTSYPAPWLRPRTDSDCLIARKDLAAFEAVFSALGYHKQFALEGDYVSYQSTFRKPLIGDSVMNIDLHWRINNRQCLSQAYSVQQIMRDGENIESLGAQITVPSRIDSLLIAAIHRLGHHALEERLVWLYDVHLLAESLDEQQWQALVRKAHEKQIAAITENTLCLSKTLLDTSIPNFVMQALSDHTDEPSAIFLKRNLPEWRFFLRDLQTMNGWRAKCGLLREHIFPNAEYIRQRMGTRSVLLGYLKRLIRGLRRVS
jgi:hypothetical protein